MAITVVNSPLPRPKGGFGDMIKDLVQDYEDEREKRLEAEDIKLISAAGADPERLRTSLGEMRSKKGKAVAMSQLGQLPTELERAHSRYYDEMTNTYKDWKMGPDRRAQERLDRDTLTASELGNVGADLKKLIPKSVGWMPGKVMDEKATAEAIQRLRDTYGYDNMGQGKRNQFNALIRNYLGDLNKGKGILYRKNQYGVPDEFDTPADQPPSGTQQNQPNDAMRMLIPMLGQLDPEDRIAVQRAISEGKNPAEIMRILQTYNGR